MIVTRVELRGMPTQDQYTRLHSAMSNAGYSRIITGDNGVRYWLPHAMYFTAQYDSADAARRAACLAAGTVTNSFEVLATRGDSAWTNLIPVS